MKRSGKLSTNTLAAGTGYLFSILLALFVSPYIVRTLGDSRYGAWTLIAEVTGYYGLLDFGIRAAVTYYVGTHTARRSAGGINETAASAFWLLSGIGLAVIGVCAGVVIRSPALLQVKNIPLAGVRSAMLIMACTLGCTLPMDVYAAVLYGNKRLELVNGIEIGGRILSSALIVVALKAGGGLIHVSAVQACAKAVEWTFTCTLAHRIAPALSVRPRFMSLKAVKALGDFGSKNLLINITRMAMDRTDLAIVGAVI
jgi:O-antigen/teichoic acid export membrane protein